MVFSKISRKYTVYSFRRTARLIEMANFVILNDNTLRQRLRQFGFRPDGPITDTTRDVYVRKLQRLERTRGAQSNTLANATPAQTAITLTVQRAIQLQHPAPVFGTALGATPHSNTFSTQSAFGHTRLPALQNNYHQSELVARSSPLEDTSRSSSVVHGKCSSVRYLVDALRPDVFR